MVMILYGLLPIDTRVLREAHYLSKCGFKVDVFDLHKPESSSSNPSPQILDKSIEGHCIRDLSPSQRANALNLTLFWIMCFVKLMRFGPIHVIHCHDLTGLPPAIIYKIFHPKTWLIYDSHELFPEAAFSSLGYLYWLLFYWIESTCRHWIDLVIGISQQQLDVLSRRLKKAPCFLILNVPDLSTIPKIPIWNNRLSQKIKGRIERIRVVCSGTVTFNRRYEEFVKAASLILEQSKMFEFWIVGGGPLLNEIRWMVKEKGIEDHFHFTGRVLFKDLLEIISQCDLAVGLYKRSINSNIGISNKIFEYMLVGIPFIFSMSLSSRPFLEKLRTPTVDPSQPKEIAEGILRLASDFVLQEHMSKTGRTWVLKELNWSWESRKFGKAYFSLLQT